MKRGLIIGINNEQSIAAGCARALAAQGGRCITTYYRDKNRDYQLAHAVALGVERALPLDIRNDGQLAAVFAACRETFGTLDYVIHSMAFAPADDLARPVVECSRAGFLEAMDLSVHSFIRTARAAREVMPNGGCLLTVSYHGGQQVIPNYHLMGPVKAALEGTVKYLAAELGALKIRVNALSPGPIATRAASGIPGFDAIMADSTARSPLPGQLSADDVGPLAAYLISDAARHVTGNVMYVDSGFHVMG